MTRSGRDSAWTVPQLFESVAARWPETPAVVYKDTALSYAELNHRANQLARYLIGRGVSPDSLVAVAVSRSAELVVAVLAVLKAGGAYLPLDPSYPVARLEYMLTDARPVLLIQAADLRIPSDDVPVITVADRELAAACARESGDNVAVHERRGQLRPDHLMYVIYTSGTSGTPKGVAVPHGGVADLVATQAERLQASPGDRVLQWASISFDAAFWDLSLGLLSGATLVMADSDDLMPGEPLRETLIKHDITHAALPPVALSTTDSDGVLTGGAIVSTGDACTPGLVRSWSGGRRMFNGYGPTEVTVGATIAGPIADPGQADRISIGHPWIGSRVYVLDDNLRPVPDGVEGELYLAGSGLARGYLNRPGFTATRFLPDPFGPPGSRMYRSGDRGSRGADGTFYFAGRADDQVKVRGFRIELGEIEACLASHPDVDIAVAMVEGELADARIVGYVATRPGVEVNPADLRGMIAASLPEYMVPARIVVLDRFPTQSNGKIDRRALRDETNAPVPGSVVAPSRENASYEEVLLGMVMELLSLPKVDLSDNLFQLGCNSVAASRLVSSIRKELGVRLPMRAVFEAETLSDLALVMREAASPTRETPTK
jgi:L-tryptophan---[L-tryptophyl-carrier protein] ligase